MPRSFRFLPLAMLVCLCLAPSAPPAMAAQAGADLALGDQTSQPVSASTGQLITYIGGFANAGPDVATDVRVQVALPAGLRFEPASSSSNCSLTGSIVTCYYASWPANVASAPDDPTIAVTGTTAGTYNVVFTISANERDRNTANNTDTATTTVVQPTEADLSLQLGSAEARAGEPFFYQFLVFNAGPAEATNVLVTLQLPTGIEYVSGGCTTSGSTVTCGPYEIPPGGGIGGLIQLRATDAGTYTITGDVSADQPDPNPANNSDTGEVTATAVADVSVSIADSLDPVKPGQSVTYTATVVNEGPSPATGVTLSETWSTTSSGIAFLSSASSQGTCTQTNASLDCQLGTLASGASLTVSVTLRPRGTGVVTATATATATEFDPDPADDTASETTTVGPR